MDGFIEQGQAPDPRWQAVIAKFETAAREIGLYLDSAAVRGIPGEGPLFMVSDLIIGDVAWSNRVQNREQAAFDHSFQELKDDVDTAEIERLRQIARRLRKEKDE